MHDKSKCSWRRSFKTQYGISSVARSKENFIPALVHCIVWDACQQDAVLATDLLKYTISFQLDPVRLTFRARRIDFGNAVAGSSHATRMRRPGQFTCNSCSNCWTITSNLVALPFEFLDIKNEKYFQTITAKQVFPFVTKTSFCPWNFA